jgi:hypothetical protein
MGKGGDWPIHGLEKLNLAERIVEMIITPNHMSDRHVVVINDHRMHVGWCSVCAQQDEVVDLTVSHGYRPLD